MVLGKNKSSPVLRPLRKRIDEDAVTADRMRKKRIDEDAVTADRMRKKLRTECLESHSYFYDIDDKDASLSCDDIRHQVDTCWRVERKEQRPNRVPEEQPKNIGYNDECLSCDIIRQQADAFWRNKGEEQRHDGVSKVTEDGPGEEAGLCDPGAEFFNELLFNYDFSDDYFPDFTTGLISVEKFLDAPCDSEKIEPCRQGIEADSLSSFIQLPGKIDEDDLPALIGEDGSPSRWYEELFPDEDLTTGS